MNETLKAKIARYTEYVRADRELCAQSPAHSQKYASRLRNHEAKLARYEAQLTAPSAPVKNEPAPNANTITRAQVSALFEKLTDYAMKHELPYFWSLVSENGLLSFTVEDFDNKHDFGFVPDILSEVGVEIHEGALLSPYEVARIEQETGEIPPAAAIEKGTGLKGEIYGFSLVIVD